MIAVKAAFMTLWYLIPSSVSVAASLCRVGQWARGGAHSSCGGGWGPGALPGLEERHPGSPQLLLPGCHAVQVTSETLVTVLHLDCWCKYVVLTKAGFSDLYQIFQMVHKKADNECFFSLWSTADMLCLCCVYCYNTVHTIHIKCDH